MTNALRACARLPGLLLCLHACAALCGVVETLDGRTLRGPIRLDAAGELLVTPPNMEPVRVALTNLLRADFAAPETTNARPDSVRLSPALLDVIDRHRKILH